MTERALPTLGDLVGGLGYELVRVVVAPRGLDVDVGDPIIHDRMAGTRFANGDVVLAVGLDPRGGELAGLVRDAGAAGAAAVVAKLDDGDLTASSALDAAAEAAGVALLRAARDVEWGQLHALARMVTATNRANGGRADRDDPLLGDLFALANAIAARTGGPVTIEDAQSRVLAYSTGDESIDDYRRDTILGRRVPEEWIRRLQTDGAFKRIWQSDDAVRISYAATEPAYRDRLVTAVRAGGEVVGTIWVQEGDQPLGDDAERVLREVAPLAALHLVRHFAGDVERRQESELVSAVLAGRVPASALSATLELRRDHQLVVLVLRPDTPDAAAGAMHLARVASVVSLYRRTERAPLAVTVAADAMHVVVCAAPDRLDAVIADLLQRARGSVRVPLAAAVAASPHGFDSLPAARVEADAVIAVSRRVEGRPARWDDVVGAAVLDRWRSLAQSRPDLTRGRLDVLLGSDRGRESQYAATLRAYLDHLGDVSSAAAHLDVHPNTFRYRLRRAVEIAGLDLDDPVERLVAHLQLHLLDDPRRET